MSVRYACPTCDTAFEALDDSGPFAACPDCGTLCSPAAATDAAARAPFAERTEETVLASDVARSTPPAAPTGSFAGLLAEDIDEVLSSGLFDDDASPPSPPFAAAHGEPPLTVSFSEPTAVMSEPMTEALLGRDASSAGAGTHEPSTSSEPVVPGAAGPGFAYAADPFSTEEVLSSAEGVPAIYTLPASLALTQSVDEEPVAGPAPGASGLDEAAPVIGQGEDIGGGEDIGEREESDEGAGARDGDALPLSLALTREEAPPPDASWGAESLQISWDDELDAEESAATSRSPPAAAAEPPVVLLSALEAQTQGLSLFSADALGEDAFGALEAAFDEVAHAPFAVAPNAPRRRPPSVDDEPGLAPLVPAGDESASGLRRLRAPVLHLTLSEEAKALAGIPLGQMRKKAEPEVTARMLRARARSREEETLAGDPAALPSETAAGPPSTDPGHEPAGGRQRTRAPAAERSPVASTTEPSAPEAPPRVWPVGKMMAAACVAFVCGLGLGAWNGRAAGETETPRAKAEQRLADGNRFYEEQRFDDALGAYREALLRDESFAAAHRAKASVLAKQKRHAEAADAYRDYLRAAPAAVDASAIREILSRYERQPAP